MEGKDTLTQSYPHNLQTHSDG